MKDTSNDNKQSGQDVLEKKPRQLTLTEQKEYKDLQRRVEKLVQAAEKIGKIEEDTAETRSMFEDLKGKVKSVEEINHSIVIVYRSSKDWMKIGGSSARMLHYKYRDMISLDLKLYHDMDVYHHFSSGTIQIKNPALLKKSLKNAGMKVWLDIDNLIIFELPDHVTMAEVKGLAEIQKEEEHRLDQLLKVGEIAPKIWREIKPVIDIGARWAGTMNAPGREYIGRRFMQDVFGLAEVYIAMAWGDIAKEQMWEQLHEQIKKVKVDLELISMAGYWELSRPVRLADKLATIEKEIIADKIYEAQIKDKKQRKMAKKAARKVAEKERENA